MEKETIKTGKVQKRKACYSTRQRKKRCLQLESAIVTKQVERDQDDIKVNVKADLKVELSDISSRHNDSSNDENASLLFVKEEEIVEDKEEASDTEDFDGNAYQLSDLELRRQENMKKNFELFQQFDIDSVKREMLASYAKPKRNVSLVGLKKEKRENQAMENIPRRKSLRIRKLEADTVNNETFLPPPSSLYHDYHERKPEVIEMTETDNSFTKVLKSWTDEKEEPVQDTKEKKEIENYKASISSLEVNHCAKATKSRIYSIAVHPTVNKTIAAFGDKYGYIGIWDVGSNLQCNGYPASEEVFLFQPHCSPINCLKFSSVDCNKLYSCGYDGTIRQGDFLEQKFSQIFAFEDEDIRCLYFASPRNKSTVLLTATSDGNVSLIDSKSGKCEQFYSFFSKATKCIDCHPVNENLFVASSLEGICATWDLRMLQTSGKAKPLSSFRSPKTATTAFFSPASGNKILYTAVDNYVRVFDVNKNGEFPMKPKWNISHDNRTGRWLTGFRAAWDPKNDNTFVIGNMGRPRKLDVYSCLETGSVELHNLYDENFTTITSVNVFHPTRNILVCGNSSGKAFVWS